MLLQMLLLLLGAEASAVLLLLTVDMPAWLVHYPKVQHHLLGPADPSLAALVASPKALQGQGSNRSMGRDSWARVGKLGGADPCASLYASKAGMH